MVLMVLLDLAQPLPLKLLFDYIIGNQSIPGLLQPIYSAIGGTVFNLLILTSVLVVSIAAVDGIVSYWGQSTVTNVGQRVVFDMRQDLYAYLQSLPLSFHERRRTGDMESEALVLRALDELTRGRTTFVITHRLPTIEDADCIYVVEGGSIIESGRHSELLLQSRRYAELYRLQVQGARSVLYSAHFEQGVREATEGESK